MKDDSIVDLELVKNNENKLTQALNALPQSEQPTRDLWPEIENKLSGQATKTYNQRWIPWAIAATLTLSFSSFYMSWNNLQTANQVVAENQFNVESALNNGIQSQIKSMEQEYGLAKSALLAQIGKNSNHSNADLLSDIKSNLIIIEQATNELKAAIIKQPQSPNLTNLLKATYQQELVVLTQLAKLDLES